MKKKAHEELNCVFENRRGLQSQSARRAIIVVKGIESNISNMEQMTDEEERGNWFIFCCLITFMTIIDVFFMLFVSIFSLGRLKAVFFCILDLKVCEYRKQIQAEYVACSVFILYENPL